MPVTSQEIIDRIQLPEEVDALLRSSPEVLAPADFAELESLALGGGESGSFDVAYDIPGRGPLLEATVAACKNGVAVNYAEVYMRRRDPDCMLIADEEPTDKERFSDRFGGPFAPVRTEILNWLGTQPLLVMPFMVGQAEYGYGGLLIAPRNAAFFACGLADLQGMVPWADVPEGFEPRSIIYLAPPFRHTHCKGRQVVVHNRQGDLHEIFSLNLYPGPSAKKGVYGVLLNIGEEEGWITIHGSTVRVITPYDNEVTITHEGASGGGKSEMLEYPHREEDGRLLLGHNLVSDEKRRLSLTQGCQLRPVTDDMAFCHPQIQKDLKKLVVTDAEDAWFLRVNHIRQYGTDPHLERLCVAPDRDVIFLNIQAVPGATCLIWEHTEDEPGKPCPNPRVILPRSIVPGIIDEPVEVDVRSFGVRCPPCTREKPTYGILGLMHLLSPSLAWLWRLVAPRGHDNPSITDTAGMSSEGVGSYWPFATGRRVVQANLLLDQIRETPGTRYVLIPNQHVGAWQVGFMPQWISREYLARRGGAKFKPEQITPARCPLLGHALYSMQVEGTQIPHILLEVDMQPEVGPEAYDAGAAMLTDFFRKELAPYLEEKDLDPQGRKIIEAAMEGADAEAFGSLLA